MTHNWKHFLSLSTALLAAHSTLRSQEAIEEKIFDLAPFTVEGEKFGRTIQDTQTSVAGFGVEEIHNSTDTDLFDIFERTANTFAKNGTFSIRGISNTGLTYSEGSDMASVLLDGAAVDSQMLQFDGLSIWDLDHVEILRGPQSTSQGRNSMAGAVVAKTKNPTFYRDAAFRAVLSEYGSSQLAVAYGAPIVDDLLAFRISATKEQSDGAFTNITRSEDDWDEQDSVNVRGKLLFQPKKWDNFSALLSYAQSENNGATRIYGYGENPNDLYDRLAYENTRDETEATSRLASLEVEKEFGNGWLLTATTAWSDFYRDATYDGDRSESSDLVYNFINDNKTTSQEIRLLGKGENWNGLIGLYAAKESRGYLSDGPFYYTIQSPLDSIFGLASPARALLSINQYSKTDITNTALFVNGDWMPSEKWTITGGLRFDHEENERDRTQSVELVQGFPDAVALVAVPSFGIPLGAPADVVLQALVADATAEGLGDDEFDTVLPTIGVTYHWDDDLSTGFTVTKGYRSGGVAFNQARAEIVAYDPEFTTNYELSLRSQWLENKITLNANAFYVDWRDQQVSVQLSNDTFDRQVENAGASTYYGFEVEIRERLTNGWSLYQNIGHTRTKFDQFTTSVDDYSGNQFPNAPQWTIGAGASYQHDSGWFGTTSITYISNVHGGPENDPNLRLGERLPVNAKIGYNTENWTVYLYGKNLLDHDYLNSLWRQGTTNRFGGQVGDPRMLGIGVDAKF